jgi:hypothetical protein
LAATINAASRTGPASVFLIMFSISEIIACAMWFSFFVGLLP